MKTSITTLFALVAGTFLVHAQGTVSIGNTAVSFLIETNQFAIFVPGVSTPATGSPANRTTTIANSFFFEVLTQTAGANTSGGVPTITPNANFFDPDWRDTGIGGKNSTLVRGGITAIGSTTVAGTWAAPTGATYSTGSVQWYLIVGWSGAYGSTWADFKNNFFYVPGMIGQSQLAYQVSGRGKRKTNRQTCAGNSGSTVAPKSHRREAVRPTTRNLIG